MSTAASVLPFFRNQWAPRLIDTVVVKERTGESFDPDTGLITPTYVELYNGPGLVRPAAAGEAEFGEATVATVDYLVFVPYTELGLGPGHLVDVTSTHDDDLTGLELVVNSVNRDSYVTVRRLDCTEAPHDAS